MERQDGREHPLAHADSRARTLESSRLGKSNLCNDARSAADPKASFRPGLYGDGDASTDRSVHRWMIYALDKQSGKVLWERVGLRRRASRKTSHQIDVCELDAGD